MTRIEGAQPALFRDPRIVRFFFVGGLNTVFGYLAFSLFVLLGLHYALAVLLAQIVGVLFNFFTTGRLVFGDCRPRVILRFIPVYAASYVLNTGLIRLLLWMGINVYLGGALVAVPVAMFTFAALRAFVFASARREAGPAGAPPFPASKP